MFSIIGDCTFINPIKVNITSGDIIYLWPDVLLDKKDLYTMQMIKINSTSSTLYTSVPNWFIDHYLPSSNGDFVKVYLVLLRCLNNHETEFSTSDFADRLHLTESDIVRALKFWSTKELIHLVLKDKDISSISFIDPSSATVIQEEVSVSTSPIALEPTVHMNLSSKPEYTMDELSTFMATNPFRDLIYVTGRYLGKNLNQNDLSTLISFHDWLGLPFDVIEWLIEYCATNEHRNMRYIEKVAIEWSDNNILSLEKAKNYTETYNKKYYGIKKALGFSNRNPVPFEIKIMDKWLNEYRFDLEIILEACDRTMKQAPNGSFQYADKILTQWYEKDVHVLKDIEQLDDQHTKKVTASKNVSTTTAPPSKNKFINYEQRDYDFDKIEKKAMEMLLKENAEGGYR